MKKILFVTAGYPDSNNRNRFIFSHELTIALKAAGYKVFVLDLNPNEQLHNTHDEYQGVPVYRYKLIFSIKHLFKSVLLINKFSAFFKKIDVCDVIIFSFLSPNYFFIKKYFKQMRKILIIHGGDVMLRWDSRRSAILKRKFLKEIDKYCAVSEATAIYLSHYVPKGRELDIHVIHNGINENKFNFNNTKVDLRNKYNISQEAFVLLTVCNLIPRKGVDIILKADKILFEEGVNFSHIIVGRGPEEQKLLDYIKINNLEKNVKIISYIENDEELAGYFQAVDIFVMMSKTEYQTYSMEGFGIVYAEAQYAGLPVLAGNSGGTLSAMRDFFTGYLIDPYKDDTHKDIAFKIKYLIKNPEIKQQMSMNAHSFVKSSFSWKNYVEKIEIFF